jgi:4-hydroxybenzoate polyprenyltransferase
MVLPHTASEQTSPSKLLGLLEIMRFDKPIGTFLLAAPTAWALLIANDGWPSWQLTLIFGFGVIVMRAAGCTANDLADRNFDGFVERTRARPLVTGAISVAEALALLFVLLLTALGLVLLTNALTIKLSFVGALLAVTYPFMKRVTYLPQFVLGAAFSWAIPMAFAASIGELPAGLWWLFVANLLWTVVYDTQYAMVDREDDLQVGIKSTAILFGELDRRIIALMQVASIGCFVACGQAFALDTPYYLAISGVAAMFIWHQWLIKDRAPDACFVAFNQSKWIGVIVLAGLVAQFTLFSA